MDWSKSYKNIFNIDNPNHFQICKYSKSDQNIIVLGDSTIFSAKTFLSFFDLEGNMELFYSFKTLNILSYYNPFATKVLEEDNQGNIYIGIGTILGELSIIKIN